MIIRCAFLKLTVCQEGRRAFDLSKPVRYYTTAEAGIVLGKFSSEWVRRKCISGELKALVYRTATRSVYRISESALAEFRRNHLRDASDHREDQPRLF